MTTSTATQVAKRRGPTVRARSPFLSLELMAREIAKSATEIAWPAVKYQSDPVGFCRDVLGYTPCETLEELVAIRDAEDAAGTPPYARQRCLWSKQIGILRALAKPRARVAVRSGHKVSKSHTFALAALWFYCCFDDARVVMSAVTSRQVDAILWRELRKVRARSKVEIPGDMHELARSGFKSADFREIVGFTAREAEAVAGISGANLLYLLDEASGIDDEIFEAIEGNRAAGARVGMASNPTQTEGEFFEAFNAKAEFYVQIAVSSEESPNVVTGRDLLPGLAGVEWVDEKKLEWGAADAATGQFIPGPLYRVRVLGEFVTNEQGRIISLHTIQQSEERWADAADEGRLHIGVDPAGPGLGGDETAFAVRRGSKILKLYTFRGLTDDAHLVQLLGILGEHRKPREPAPVVAIDREGPIGATVYGVIRGAAERNGFEVCGVRSSERARRCQDRFERVRDELWWSLYEWMRDGGAIPEDGKLAAELHAPQWEETISRKARATGKSDLRKMLERSPDRADACALSVWEPPAWKRDSDKDQQTKAIARPHVADRDRDDVVHSDQLFDPYGAR